MAKVKVMGNVMSIKSTITLKDFEKVAGFAPDALTLQDREGNMLYRVGYGIASMGKLGINFDDHLKNKGALLLNVILPVPCDSNKVKQFIADNYAGCLHNLEYVEKNVSDVMQQVNTFTKDVISRVDFVDDEEAETDIPENSEPIGDAE